MTRGSAAKKNLAAKERMKAHREKLGSKEAKRKANRERYRSRKISDQLMQDELRNCRTMIEKQKKIIKKLQDQIDDLIGFRDISFDEPQQMTDPQSEEKHEKEEIKKGTYAELEKIAGNYISDDVLLKDMTSLDRRAFNQLVSESISALEMTTDRGDERISVFTKTPVTSHTFIFLTLFWLRHYPSMKLFSALFKIHA